MQKQRRKTINNNNNNNHHHYYNNNHNNHNHNRHQGMLALKTKEREKQGKYQEIARELWFWGVRIQGVPVIVDALVLILENLRTHLMETTPWQDAQQK